jgi:alpha-1,3-rhamnosyl/mannosyltransferase
MLGLRVDLYHAIGLSIPYTLPFPIVVTVFDLIPLRFPEAYIGNPVWRLGYMNEIRLIRRAKQVIAISECTRQDIIRFLSVPPERITVTGCGVSRGFFRRCPPEHVEAVKRKHGLENPFVLYVGEFDPRKNFAGLVRIFARVREQVNSAVTLVAVGRLAPTYTQEIRGMIQKHGLGDSICLIGAVSNEDLHALFQASEVLAFPSLYEGFGLPCVEAMAAGTPVVAYAVSSLPEVVADAGILVPLNEEALFAEAIVSLLMDQTLRTQYIQKGMTHARQFTWENTARKTLEAYARAV